jgi:hypothetical protein
MALRRNGNLTPILFEANRNVHRGLALLFRLLLIAAFVPILIGASVGVRPALVAVFLLTAALSWLSLRLWASLRWKPMGLLLAAGLCAAIWALAFATMQR